MVFTPLIIPVIAITSVILTTIKNTDLGYHVSDMPQGLVTVGFPEQWVPPRNLRWLDSSFCFVSNVGYNMTL